MVCGKRSARWCCEDEITEVAGWGMMARGAKGYLAGFSAVAVPTRWLSGWGVRFA